MDLYEEDGEIRDEPRNSNADEDEFSMSSLDGDQGDSLVIKPPQAVIQRREKRDRREKREKHRHKSDRHKEHKDRHRSKEYRAEHEARRREHKSHRERNSERREMRRQEKQKERAKHELRQKLERERKHLDREHQLLLQQEQYREHHRGSDDLQILEDRDSYAVKVRGSKREVLYGITTANSSSGSTGSSVYHDRHHHHHHMRRVETHLDLMQVQSGDNMSPREKAERELRMQRILGADRQKVLSQRDAEERRQRKEERKVMHMEEMRQRAEESRMKHMGHMRHNMSLTPPESISKKRKHHQAPQVPLEMVVLGSDEEVGGEEGREQEEEEEEERGKKHKKKRKRRREEEAIIVQSSEGEESSVMEEEEEEEEEEQEQEQEERVKKHKKKRKHKREQQPAIPIQSSEGEESSDSSSSSSDSEEDEETADESEEEEQKRVEELKDKNNEERLSIHSSGDHSSDREELASHGDASPNSPPSSSSLPPSPVHSPIELKEQLPAYFPAIMGCRSVDEFECLNRIEEGTYGVVYRAREKTTNTIVALKKLKMEKEKEGFPITSLREVNTLLKGQHENIVTVREIVVGSNIDKIYIVMDYVEHDLKSLMETMRQKSQSFTIGETKTLLIQLMRAVDHLHDRWILHRDLKTSNLLLSHRGILKVGDFGLAREYGSPLKQYTPIVVTLWYRAPELLLGAKEYSCPIDVWSVGCIFGELLAMEPMFPGKSEIDQLNKIFKELGTPSDKIWPGYSQLPMVKKTQFANYPYNHLRDTYKTRLSNQGFNLLNRLLTYDSSSRITCRDALRHDYFLTETPSPIDPSMFPTWPAKSENPHGKPKKTGLSPKPPSGGKIFKELGDGEDENIAGFFLGSQAQSGPGFTLKF